jgi:hypothetical protein
VTEHSVRMRMSVAEGEALDEILHRTPADVTERVMDQLWLRSVFVEQRRRTTIAERPKFDERADCILANLDPSDVDG